MVDISSQFLIKVLDFDFFLYLDKIILISTLH